MVADGLQDTRLLVRQPNESRTDLPPRCLGCSGAATAPVALQLSDTDVLVCARGGGGLLRERMALVAALWANHVRAEFLHAVSPSVTEQYQYAGVRGIKWLVMLEEARLRSADTVTVKCLERKVEEHVPYKEVNAPANIYT